MLTQIYRITVIQIGMLWRWFKKKYLKVISPCNLPLFLIHFLQLCFYLCFCKIRRHSWWVRLYCSITLRRVMRWQEFNVNLISNQIGYSWFIVTLDLCAKTRKTYMIFLLFFYLATLKNVIIFLCVWFLNPNICLVLFLGTAQSKLIKYKTFI